MSAMLTIARRAAEEAGKIIRNGFGQLEQIQIEEKGRADLVSVIDQRAEAIIKNVLFDKFPNHDFLGEETGATQINKEESEFLWVVDPLDGTTNFLHGIPHFAVSIALLKQGKLEASLVLNPISGEIFSAVRGQGAQFDGRKIRVNQNRNASRTIVATGFPTRTIERLPEQYKILSSVLNEFGDIRRFGAAALDLCFTACNRFSGYFEIGIHPWDIAAGILIAQEAGAIVTDFEGKSASIYTDKIICANQYLHKILLNQIKNA